MTAKLSVDQEKAFVDQLAKHTRARKWFCPFCEVPNTYRPSGLVYLLPGYKVDTEKKTLVDLEGPAMPVGALICQKCGYTHFFSAVFSGTLFDALGMK